MKFIFVNVILTFFLLELVSRFFLVPLYEDKMRSLESKELIWGAKHLPLKEQNRIKHGYLGKVPHPFFGFSHFESSFETPEFYNKNEKIKYRAAIFGGSVAEQIGDANKKTEALNKFIQRKYNLVNKDVEVVNFALSGYRQPQSYFISAIYGQHNQMAINIEGVNELGDTVSDLPPYFPMGFISNFYFRSLEEMSKVPELHARAIQESYLRKKLESEKIFFSSEKLYYLVSRFLNLSKIQSTSLTDEKDPQYRFHKDVNWNHSMLKKLESWLKFSCLQQNVMKNFGTANYFVIQPVPQNFKPLSIDEKKIVETSREGELEIAEFISKVDFSPFKSTGLNIIDLRKVFSSHPETLYMDSCCHFNAQGDNLFLQAIIDEIEKIIHQPPKECNFQKLIMALRQ